MTISSTDREGMVAVSPSDNEKTQPRSGILLDRMETLLFGHDGLQEEASPSREVALPITSWDAFGKRYERRRLLGGGGVAEVHLTYDRCLRRHVALKILKPRWFNDKAMRGRFVQEAQVMAQLNHSGIPAIFDCGQLNDGQLFFTMEFVSGELMTSRIAQMEESAGAFPELRRLLLDFVKLCQIVVFAHQRGAVHRDLKPNNVICTPAGEVSLVDWGLVKVGPDWVRESEPQESDNRDASASITGQGRAAGTPAYMAPEQANATKGAAHPAADIYSLGVILYEILTQRRPYVGQSAEQILAQVRTGPPASLFATETDQALPATLVDLCTEAMARDPKDRIRSVELLASSIERWLEDTDDNTSID